MPVEFVSTKNAPPPAAPYSQATKANGMVFISGQVPLTPEGKMISGTIQEEAQQCFDNLKAILDESGSSIDKIVRIGVFTDDISYFGDVNVIYTKFFNGHKPARTFVAVKSLPLNARVEIEAIALA